MCAGLLPYPVCCLRNQFAQVLFSFARLFDFESVCYSNIFTASTKNFTWRAREVLVNRDGLALAGSRFFS